MIYSAPLAAAVVPTIIQLPTPEVCSSSVARANFLNASRVGLEIVAAVRGEDGKSAQLPSFTADQSAVAIVQITGVGVSWVVQTEPFALAPGVIVPLDTQASNINGVALAGRANLQFSLDAFSLLADASLQGVPHFPPSDGAKLMTILYTLVVDGVPIQIERLAATMNVEVIPTLIGGARLFYTMGENSIQFGNLHLPNFSIPFGATRATGEISLAGGGFSIDWPLELTIDPFQNILGTIVYPGNLQNTTGFGADFSGIVDTCPGGSCAPSMNGFFLNGAATVFNTGSLLIPNYVQSVTGNVTLSIT